MIAVERQLDVAAQRRAQLGEVGVLVDLAAQRTRSRSPSGSPTCQLRRLHRLRRAPCVTTALGCQ